MCSSRIRFGLGLGSVRVSVRISVVIRYLTVIQNFPLSTTFAKVYALSVKSLRTYLLLNEPFFALQRASIIGSDVIGSANNRSQ